MFKVFKKRAIMNLLLEIYKLRNYITSFVNLWSSTSMTFA